MINYFCSRSVSKKKMEVLLVSHLAYSGGLLTRKKNIFLDRIEPLESNEAHKKLYISKFCEFGSFQYALYNVRITTIPT